MELNPFFCVLLLGDFDVHRAHGSARFPFSLAIASEGSFDGNFFPDDAGLATSEDEADIGS